MSTLSSGYDSQLSTMSDHLCELRDDLLKKEEELEDYRRNTSGKVGGYRSFCFSIVHKKNRVL